jgi:hypothetical protein
MKNKSKKPEKKFTYEKPVLKSLDTETAHGRCSDGTGDSKDCASGFSPGRNCGTGTGDV